MSILGLDFVVVNCPKCGAEFPAFREEGEEVPGHVGDCPDCGRAWRIQPGGKGTIIATPMSRS